MAIEEVEDEAVDLMKRLLLNKMASFSHESLQVRHIRLNSSTSNVVLNSWKFQHIIFLPHYQQCWNFDFRNWYIQLCTHRPKQYNAANHFNLTPRGSNLGNNSCTTHPCHDILRGTGTYKGPAMQYQNPISHTRRHRWQDHCQWTNSEEELKVLPSPWSPHSRLLSEFHFSRTRYTHSSLLPWHQSGWSQLQLGQAPARRIMNRVKLSERREDTNRNYSISKEDSRRKVGVEVEPSIFWCRSLQEAGHGGREGEEAWKAHLLLWSSEPFLSEGE